MSHSVSPNILIVLCDQLRFDCVGACGNKDVQTPYIDALARDGIVFSNAFTTFPVCTPARYSLLTGLYVHQHLGWTNRSTLPHGLHTFPRLLKQQGYKTACVGKMHYTPTYSDVGFDTMILSEQDGPGRYDDDYHHHLMERGLADCVDLQDQEGGYRGKAPREYFNTFGITRTNLPDDEYSTEWIGDRACERLASWSGQGSNLLMAGFIKPHHPHDVPDRWSNIYDKNKLSLLPGWTGECIPHDRAFAKGFFDYSVLDEAKYRTVLAKYYGAITEIDHQVGRMVAILKEKGIYDDCLIVFTSDHGEYMGFHHLLLKSNYMYDPLARIPLVVKFPRNDKQGTIVDKLVNTINITGTILETGKCVIPQELWNSVRPLLDDEPCTTIFAEDDRDNYMIRTISRKLLISKSKQSQYFDLTTDPFEKHDLFDNPACKDEIAELKDRLFEWLAFDSRSRVHVDHDAPVRQPSNGIKRDEAHAKKTKNYFKDKMEQW